MLKNKKYELMELFFMIPNKTKYFVIYTKV